MAENENICFLCEYMRVIDKPGNKWAPTFCDHPDSMYIENYRKTHNLKSEERFVGWTKRYSKELTIKTRPRWCPEKEGWSVKKPDTTKCWEYKKKRAALQVCRQKKELKNSAIKSINIDSSQDALRFYTTLDNGHISMVITGTVTMSFEDFIDCFEKVE